MANINAAGRLPLPTELHDATRTEHSALNRSIIARLPLCLPQATSTTILYAQGMTVLGQIYNGFEEAWDKLMSENIEHPRHRKILSTLYVPQLRRSQRLRDDIAHISSRHGPAVRLRLSELERQTLNFRDEIVQSIVAKPHLLMAYTWAMYLALFNGGRFIVKQLLGAGSLFWGDIDRTTTTGRSLSFWYFSEDETYDGEDLKLAFKDRFNDAADQLTDAERDEVIAECKKIFKICADLVRYLDDHIQQPQEGEIVPSAQETGATINSSSHGGLLDSILSLAPASASGVWRSVVNRIPFSHGTLSVPLRQDFEQRNG